MHIKRILKRLHQHGLKRLARWQSMRRRRFVRPMAVQLEFPQWLKR